MTFEDHFSFQKKKNVILTNHLMTCLELLTTGNISIKHTHARKKETIPNERVQNSCYMVIEILLKSHFLVHYRKQFLYQFYFLLYIQKITFILQFHWHGWYTTRAYVSFKFFSFYLCLSFANFLGNLYLFH